jgi:uncharacterized protein (DUF58 family)
LPEPAGRSDTQQLRVRWGLSSHAHRLITLALAGLVVAVITRRPEFAGLAAPAVLLLATWHADRPAELTVRVSPPAAQFVEGMDYAIRVTVAGHGGYDAEVSIEAGDSIDVGPAVVIPAEAGKAGTAAGRAGTAAGKAGTAAGRAGTAGSAVLPFTPQRWGQRQIGILDIKLRDRYRLTEGWVQVGLPWIGIRPVPAPLRSSVVLSRLPSRLGEHASRAAGEGGEFAGVREFVPGDRQRRINWPATTRLGKLHLSTFAAERTQNLVVIADTTTDVGETGSSTLDHVLRGSAGVITRYLAARDRVGLIIYAGQLTWIGPGQGQRHFQRLLDMLVTSAVGTDRAANLTRLPRAALPPGALIIVFSPLLDPRLIEALRDLRERGFSVVVVDVLDTEPRHDNSRLSNLTSRVWRLEQQAIRFALTQIGVPVVRWSGNSDLDEPLAPYTRRVLVVRR